jgi:hypothetical protein
MRAAQEGRVFAPTVGAGSPSQSLQQIGQSAQQISQMLNMLKLIGMG